MFEGQRVNGHKSETMASENLAASRVDGSGKGVQTKKKLEKV